MSGLRQLSLWLGSDHDDSSASAKAALRIAQIRSAAAGVAVGGTAGETRG